MEQTVERVLEVVNAMGPHLDSKFLEVNRRVEALRDESLKRQGQTDAETHNRKSGSYAISIIALIISAVMMIVGIGALLVEARVKSGEVKIPKIGMFKPPTSALSLAQPQFSSDPTIAR